MANYQSNKLVKKETNWHLPINTQIDDVQTDVTAVENEITQGRGSASDLDARLSVAINDDGTLKGSAPASGWWTTEGDTVAFVDASTFTVVGDKTAIYEANRALHLDQTSDGYGFVLSSSYNGGTGLTTVVVISVVVDSGLSSVEYGQVVANSPNYVSRYETIWVGAAAMVPSETNGAMSGTKEYATNDINVDYFAFDGAAKENVEFDFSMPEEWDRSDIKAKFYWSPGDAACTAGDKVEWEIAAGAFGDDDAIDAALGTSQVIYDTVLAGKDGDRHRSSATPAITVGGSPALGDLVHFKISRNVGSADDDMTEDAWLFGCLLQLNKNQPVVAW